MGEPEEEEEEVGDDWLGKSIIRPSVFSVNGGGGISPSVVLELSLPGLANGGGSNLET